MEQFLTSHSLLGVAIGLATFLIIGLFHPIVIKAEYWWGERCRWFFVLLGCGGIALSVAIHDVFWSTLAGVFAFSSFWSVKEIKDQAKRVEKGWFPANPKRKNNKKA